MKQRKGRELEEEETGSHLKKNSQGLEGEFMSCTQFCSMKGLGKAFDCKLTMTYARKKLASPTLLDLGGSAPKFKQSHCRVAQRDTDTFIGPLIALR
jgi:hypothetical protein